MKHLFFPAVLLFLVFSFAPETNLSADIISIDFDDLSYNDAVYDQYSSDGIIFVDGLSSPTSAPGKIVTGGYISDNALGANSMDPGIFLLFTMPVYSLSTFVLEGPLPEVEPEPEAQPEPAPYPEPEPEPEAEPEEPGIDDGPPEEGSNTVYLKAFGDDNYNLLNDDNTFVNALGAWQELIFISDLPIAAIQLRGTSDFMIDSIIISTTSETLPEPVPEPSTMLLLYFGLSGLAGFRNRFKKE